MSGVVGLPLPYTVKVVGNTSLVGWLNLVGNKIIDNYRIVIRELVFRIL